MVTRPVCAIDTESTSLTWSREAWEVSLIRRWPDGHVQDAHFFLDVDLKRADPKALECGGFYERHPRGLMLSQGRKVGATIGPEVAAEKVARLTHGATIIGAQPAFDLHILTTLLHRQGIPASWHYRVCDVEALAAGHLGRPLVSLVDSAAALGIDFPEAEQHTAQGDARIALAIYDHILGGAS